MKEHGSASSMLRFRGCEELRQRIALSCLSGKPIRVDDIRSDDEAPGLRGFEASLLRLTEKISNGCVVEINETGAASAVLMMVRAAPTRPGKCADSTCTTCGRPRITCAS